MKLKEKKSLARLILQPGSEAVASTVKVALRIYDWNRRKCIHAFKSSFLPKYLFTAKSYCRLAEALKRESSTELRRYILLKARCFMALATIVIFYFL